MQITLDKLSSIKPNQLMKYLSRRGWRKVHEYERSNSARYDYPDISNLSIIVPTSNTVRDYSHTVKIALKVLTQLEERNANELVKEIVSPFQGENSLKPNT